MASFAPPYFNGPPQYPYYQGPPQYPYYQGPDHAARRIALLQPRISVCTSLTCVVPPAAPQYLNYVEQDAAYLRTVRGDGKPADPKVVAAALFPVSAGTCETRLQASHRDAVTGIDVTVVFIQMADFQGRQ